MALIPPKINVGAAGPVAWLQAGLSYGVNDSGAFQSFSRRGPQAEIEALVSAFFAGGWSYTVTREEAGLARIEAHAGWSLGSTYPGTEVAEDLWELDPNEVEKNLLECDFLASGALGEVSKENKRIIKEALNHPLDYKTTYPAFTGSGSDVVAAQMLFDIMMANVTSFPVEASVIRHTLVVSNRYTIQASYNNCNRIISSASMTSVESVPTDLLFAMPPSPTPTQYIATGGDLKYGWRKLRPAVTRLARFKWRIVQNYQFGLWAVRLYGTVI